MRIVAVSDIHLNIEAVFALREKMRNRPVDAVVVAGDITSNGSAANAEQILKEMRLIARIFAVPGNLDSQEVAELLEKKGISLHNRVLPLENYRLAGFGGGLNGSAGKINFSEKQLEKSLEGLLDGDCSKTILITHLPPFGTSLDVAGSKHIGSRAVKKIIEEKQPLLHVCGHAHDSSGEEIFGRTLSVNVGALKNFKAAVIDFNGKIHIERMEL